MTKVGVIMKQILSTFAQAFPPNIITREIIVFPFHSGSPHEINGKVQISPQM